MSYLAPVPPSLGQLRLDISRRLAEATVLGTPVNFDGIDYFHYTPADMLEMVSGFAAAAAEVSDADSPRFLKHLHTKLRRLGYVYSNWDAKKPDLLVKSLSDYLRARRAASVACHDEMHESG